MYKGKLVSVVISTYRERNSIRTFIEDCYQTDYVDEVIVVDNNAEEGTEHEVLETPAVLVSEKRQGYGWGYRRGLKEASGDYIIMTEADGTFNPMDFEKLLVYAQDFPVVFCTRTSTYTIMEGANMGLFLKWGNWAVAKVLEIIFGTTQLSDVGCTTRLLHSTVLERIQPYFTVGGSHFGLEMTIFIILAHIPFIEIPIHYSPRVGQSSVTESFYKTLQLGLTMFFFSLRHRVNFKLRRELLALDVPCETRSQTANSLP